LNIQYLLFFRYYRPITRTEYDRPNFFMTNRGEKVNKLYDELNKTFGAKLSANIFRRMLETEGRGHDAAKNSGIARALQHSNDTALRYYRVPDTAEAVRRQQHLDVLVHTTLVRSYIDKQWVTHPPINQTYCILTVIFF